jgi:hypothetical protein
MDEVCDMYGGKMEKHTESLCGESEGMKPFGTPRCSWGRNIKVYLKEIFWEKVGWIHLAQDKKKLYFLYNAVKNV